MGCGCNDRQYPPVSRRCKCSGTSGEINTKGVVDFCDLCDPCNPQASTVRICAFVVPTLEDGRYYKNSFVFTQDEDATYYISDDRSEIPFGTRPKFIDDFDPTTYTVKNSIVFDMKNGKAYVFGPDSAYMELVTITPLSDSTAPTTATVGRLGQIYIDTTSATAYMCTAVDDVTPSYTWKAITA